ncbi:MAG: flagellar protein FlaG [Chloroflexota bacterium]
MNEMNVTPISPPAGDSSARVQHVVDFYSEKAAAAPRRSEAGESAASPSPQPRTSDVVLRFNVDRETHEVTVYIMDRASRQIIRTIPPDELSKLKAGDLIELMA